jgi:hypothetical protein
MDISGNRKKRGFWLFPVQAPPTGSGILPTIYVGDREPGRLGYGTFLKPGDGRPGWKKYKKIFENFSYCRKFFVIIFSIKKFLKNFSTTLSKIPEFFLFSDARRRPRRGAPAADQLRFIFEYR